MKSMTDYYNQILSDKSIIALYGQIHAFEEVCGGWAHHDFNHVVNVASYCEKILRALNYPEGLISEAKVAAILHDVGCIEGKEGHAQRSCEFAKKYFEENNILLQHSNMVLEAIENHSEGFDSDNILQLVLILADKIDMKRSRLSEAGRQIEGNRQFEHISDIDFKIEGGNFYINFLCDEGLDIEELNNYYFTKKVFKAIGTFSQKLNLQPHVLINGKKWEAFYKLLQWDF